MNATHQVARQKESALADSSQAPLGHGEDAFAPATQKLRWTPDARDHLVYHLVKFGGKTQDLAAKLLGISQPSVSRIIDRYERWQAHANEREGGRLDHAERLRAQRWLTYERNELILASSLRIAAEMEGFIDVSKSVISRPLSQITQESEIRTEHATLDRHGIAARFLRLAFRINMEQLKLVSQDPPPLPEPLTTEQLAEEEAASAAILAEFEAVERAAAEAADAERRRVAEQQRVAGEMAELDRAARERSDSGGGLRLAEIAEEETGRRDARPTAEAVAESAIASDDPPVEEGGTGEDIQPVNRVNKRRVAESDASHAAACICVPVGDCSDFPPGGVRGPLLTPPTPDSLFAFL